MNKYLKLILSLVAAFFFMSFGLKYIEYSYIKGKSEPIVYNVVNNEHHAGGRGSYDVLIVSFNNKNYKTNITSKMLIDLREGKKPTLYYSDISNQVFSLWDIKSSIRISILFGVFLLILVLVHFKIIPFRRNLPRHP